MALVGGRAGVAPRSAARRTANRSRDHRLPANAGRRPPGSKRNPRSGVGVGARRAEAEVRRASRLARAVLQAAIDSAHIRSRSQGPGSRSPACCRRSKPVAIATRASDPATSGSHRARRRGDRRRAAEYVASALYGAPVAAGVAQEKTSRPRRGAARGREAGAAAGRQGDRDRAAGLGQLAIAVVAGLIANAAIHSAKIPASIWGLLPVFLVCFLAGFTLYASRSRRPARSSRARRRSSRAIVPIAMAAG